MSNWATMWLNLRYHWKAALVWGLGVALVFLLWVMSGRAGAWTTHATHQPFPDGRATFILHTFCLSDWCPISPGEWRTMIEEAVEKWAAAGSGFEFSVRSASPSDDPCRLNSGEVAVIWTDGQRKCSEDFPLPPNYGGLKGVTGALLGQRASRVYLYANRSSADEFEIKLLAPFILLHEFGHVLGLGHPNEVGQTVEAVMNSGVPADVNFRNPQLRPDDIAGIQALYGVRTTTPTTPDTTQPMRGFLENPSPGTHASGISVVSGWVCEAGPIVLDVAGVTTTAQVVLQISRKYPDGSDVIFIQEPIPYGSNRQDTKPVCGDAANGFGLLFNWSNLGDGEYTVIVHVGRGTSQSEELGRSKVTVSTLGEPFRRGLAGEYVLEDFPSPGQSVVVEWEQSLQNFVITEHRR